MMTRKRHENYPWVLLLLLKLLIIKDDKYVNAISIPNLSMDCYIQEGDLNIGYIKQIHKMNTDNFCGEELESSLELQFVEAFRWAIDQVNAKADLLPNMTLGFVILDDCGRDLTALAKSLYLIPSNNHQKDR